MEAFHSKPQLPFDIPEAEPLTPAIQALIDHKISEPLARKFEAEQGKEELLRCVAKYEAKVKGGKVESSEGGYLLAMLEGRAGKQSKAELEAQEQQKRKQTEAQQKAEEEATQEAFKQAQNDLIAQFLDGLDEEKQKELIEEFEASKIFKNQIKDSPFVSEKYKEDGIGGFMIQAFYKKFILNTYLPEEYRDIERWKSIKIQS